MFLNKVIKSSLNKNTFNNGFISPILKKGNLVQLYLYKFLKNRVELSNIKGVVVNVKKRKGFFSTTTITLQQKLYGIVFNTKYQLNTISLVCIRVLKNK